MNSNFKTGRPNPERGSALLIVFVFAAFVAIMLYREMPIAAFEAQRQKEQMLIDRGEQYKRAVKLFYKKFGMYPASIEQLEDTNRMRFLRHRFTDPLTGKDDWRLLHMGPGGMLVDSKVNPLKMNNQAQSASTFGSNSGFGGNQNIASNSGFGASANQISGSANSFNSTSNSGFGSNTSSSANSGFSSSFSQPGASWSNSGNDPNAVTVMPVPRRRGAMTANRAAPPSNPADASQPAQLDAGQSPESAQAGQVADNGQGSQIADSGQRVQYSGPAGSDQPGQLQTPDGQQQNTQVQNNGQNSADQMDPAAGTQGQNSMRAIRRMLTDPRSQPQTSGGGGFRVMSGGLAGVASKAQGHTIKVVNDQEDYSLWEFYYDPAKDVKQLMGVGAGLNAVSAPNRNINPAPAPAASQNGFQRGVGPANPANSVPNPDDPNAVPPDVPTTTDTGSPQDDMTPEPEPPLQ